MINIHFRRELRRPNLHRGAQLGRHYAGNLHQGKTHIQIFISTISLNVQDHAEKAAGIILIGSYLPDLFGDQSNAFPVPVLTVVGELDGLTISYVYRSVESQVFSIKMSLFTQGVQGVHRC